MQARASIGSMPAIPTDLEQLLRSAYAAFNARDLDAAIALMTPDVDWPNAVEGGRVHGHAAVREYWTRQFRQVDPHVEPRSLRATADGDGRIAVDVHQVVRSLDGAIVADNRVIHEYTVRDGLIERMDVVEQPTPPVHRYEARTAWTGTTAVGFDAYGRAHEASCPPANALLQLSSDPVFKGDPAKLNPEQLLVLAASSCQLLSFLAVAARARVDVVGYEDDAEGAMPEDERPMRIARIVLKPRVTVRGTADTPDDARLRQLTETAHRHCFIANSLTTEVVVEPTFSRTA
jgi:organic hydroperoxide reductase OsmC/OhrA